MEQGKSSETTRFSASQEIPRILWTRKIHYRTYKCTACPSPESHFDYEFTYIS